MAVVCVKVVDQGQYRACLLFILELRPWLIVEPLIQIASVPWFNTTTASEDAGKGARVVSGSTAEKPSS